MREAVGERKGGEQHPELGGAKARSARIASPATLSEERSRKLTIPAINSSVRVIFCTRRMRNGVAPVRAARVSIAIVVPYRVI